MVLYPNKLPESERVCSGICKTPSEGLQKAFGLLKKRFDVSDKTLRRST